MQKRVNEERFGERLEPRRLLAADLAVTMDEFTFSEPGDEVTRVIRVHNQGDALASDVLIRSNAAEDLQDASWNRVRYSQPTLSLDPTAADLIIASDDWVEIPVGIGDVNGDGWADFGILTRTSHYVVFGTGDNQQRKIVFNEDGVPSEESSQWLTKLVSVPGGRNWKPMGDVNFDGLADFRTRGALVYGRVDFAELDSLRVGSRQGTLLGDVNGDGVLDRRRGNLIELGSNQGSPQRLRVGDGVGFQSIDDINADGVTDLLLWDDSSSRLVSSRIVWGAASLSEKTLSLRSDIGLGIPANILDLSNIGDVNDDGFDDFAGREYPPLFDLPSSAVTVVLGGPQARSFSVPIGVGGLADRSMSIDSADVNGDVNGDGLSDLVAQDDNVVFVAFGRETYGDEVLDWSAEPHHTVENVNLQSMCTSCATRIRDVNGDGIGDLIFVGRDAQRRNVWYIHVVFGSADLLGRSTDFADLNPAHGILLQIDHDATYGGGYVPRLAVGDYNGDGRADLAIGEGGQVTVVFPRDLQGTVSLEDVKAGVQGKAFQLAYPHRLPVAVASTLDVTGDGIEDFVVGDSPPGAWTEVYPGQIHLVEGRRNFQLSGDANVSMPELSIPAGGTATVTIEGTLPAGENLTGRFRVLLQHDLILLNPRDATVYLAERADVNLDGLVDFEDFRILSENFGTVDASRDQGDLDKDGVVGFRDFLILSAEYGKKP